MSSLLVITDWPLRDGWESDFLRRALMREGIHEKEITWDSILAARPYGGQMPRSAEGSLSDFRRRFDERVGLLKPTVILALGDSALFALCGKSGIDKWQASLLHEHFGVVIPCYSMERVSRDFSLQMWLGVCARKAAAALRNKPKEPKYDFLLNPPLPEAISFLEKASRAERLSVDIETGRGQINTIGFAISPTEAIAINVLPDRLAASSHYELWVRIKDLLEGPQPKILQNFIYETLFLSRYGIRLNNVGHDTMIAQKFLWPEFEMGLDAVGRMYTEMPYWKEDGKSWNNIRDWERHYDYNCKDTVGTYQGYLGQRKDLESRGLTPLHDDYLRKLYPAVAEMCSWGFPVSPQRLSALKEEVGSEITGLLTGLRKLPGAESLNPRSPAQVKAFIQAKGYVIPKKYDSKEKKYKESTDEKSLKKLRMKYPEDDSLSVLLRLAKLNKAHSSYLSFKPDPDNRMRYSLCAAGTETMRMAGHCDPWDNGFNPQTAPGGGKGINVKSVFACEPGLTLVQIDLKQAESRFVAYDSADPNLIATLEDPKRDIHKEVAAEIYGITVSEVTKQQRQLGKKSGHGANYSMKEATFMDSCISEMDLVLSKAEANKVLEAYHKLFPGIRRWHEGIRRELVQTRMLKTPWGFERHFWGRMDDDTFRQAYAFRPQSTIPFVVNKLMLHLLDLRQQGQLDFRLLLQCHDSLLLEVRTEVVSAIASACFRYDNWHPVIDLAGGRLRIPVSIECGQNWGKLENYKEEN